MVFPDKNCLQSWGRRAEVDPVNCVVPCLSRTLPLSGQKITLEINFCPYIHGEKEPGESGFGSCEDLHQIIYSCQMHRATSLRLERRPSYAIRIPLLGEKAIIPVTLHLSEDTKLFLQTDGKIAFNESPLGSRSETYPHFKNSGSFFKNVLV